MRTVSLRLLDLQRSVIPIGFEDENLHTQVRIDCKKLFEEYPNALPSLAVVPPKGTAYPAIVTKDGDYVVWDVTASDTAVEGTGEIQLTFGTGEEVSKSYVGKVHVMRTIRASGTAPDPIQNWITIANVVLDSVAHAVESALHTPIIDDNGYWNVWDADEEEYVPTEYKAEGTDGLDGVGITSIEKTGTSGLVDTYTVTFTNGTSMTFTVTNGEDGTDGISPTATVTKSGKIATITITDKNGTTSVQLSDGEDADPTELIDDTAGSGATGKTWSADKLESETSSLMTQINSKQDAPSTAGTAGQVLGLDSNLAPVWQTPSGGGGTVDDRLLPSSLNPVQNKVVTAEIVHLNDEIYDDNALASSATSNGWRLNESDGNCSSNSDYKMVKYQIVAGKRYKVVSDDRFQFQIGASVPSSGTNTRIGFTYGIGTYFVTAPENATYLIVSTPTTSQAAVYICDGIETIREHVESLEENSNIVVWVSVSWDDMNTAGDTGYIGTNGSITAYANEFTSPFENIDISGEVKYKLAYIYGPCLAIAFYDSEKRFISGVTAQSGSSGSFVVAEGTVTAPQQTEYIRFSMSKNSEGGISYGDQYIQFKQKQTLKSVVEDIVGNDSSGSQWRNKKWVAFGTSITNTSSINPETGESYGKYVPALADLSGMTVTNRGIAGGTMGSGGIHGGSHNILDAILNSNDLDDFDLITIEGFVNDYACAISIGDIGDTAYTTFCGALHQAISYCLANSHAQVVLITESTGRQYTVSGAEVDYRILKKNSLDLYQQAYNDAMIRMGQYYGVHVIDAGGKSQINQYHPEYLADHIHHSSEGGQQFANAIWEELKNIQLGVVAEV